MIRFSNRICRANYDIIVVVGLIIFSLIQIKYRYSTLKTYILFIPSCLKNITFKCPLRVHISPMKSMYIRNVSMNYP